MDGVETRHDQGGAYTFMSNAAFRKNMSWMLFGRDDMPAHVCLEIAKVYKDNSDRLQEMERKLRGTENSLQNLHVALTTTQEVADFLHEVLEDTTNLRDRLGEQLESLLSWFPREMVTGVGGCYWQRPTYVPPWIKEAKKAIEDWKYIRDAGKETDED